MQPYIVTISANTSWYLYNFRASTIKSLISKGYRVICLSPSDGYEEKIVSDFGCEWVPLQIDNQGSNPIKDLGLVYQFWRIYRQFKPDVALHFTIKNNIYGTWAARLLHIPAINNVSGLGTAFIHKGLVAFAVRLLYKLSFPLAFHVFCQNEEDTQLLIRERLVPQAKLTRIPGSGVNIHRFLPPPSKLRGVPFTFLFAGRMLADKGLFELIEAVHKINAVSLRCQLLLYGFLDVRNITAVSRDQMSNWTEEPYIYYLGSSDCMEKELVKTDCVVLPSYREGMPRSLLEAGAMGLPSIATNVAGCRHVIEHGVNGLLCEAKSVESLQVQMEALMAMSDAEFDKLCEAAREVVVQNFSEDTVVQRTLEVIERAIN